MKVGDKVTLKYDHDFCGIITATVDDGQVILYQTSYSDNGVPKSVNLSKCELEKCKDGKFGFTK